jgi:hypothetical protein
MAKVSVVDTGLANLRKPFVSIISLVHPSAGTRALSCNKAASQPATVCDDAASRNAAWRPGKFRMRNKCEPSINLVRTSGSKRLTDPN